LEAVSISEDVSRYLKPGYYIDSDSEEVRAFTARALEGAENASDTQRAILLFNAVRDGIRYDPFNFDTETESYKASLIANRDSAYCVPKAILLTAGLRAAGIPAAIGFADVRNHLTTPKLMELMGSDLFIYHGYVQIWVDGNSFKVTPAFNMELCERFGVKPLEFDGTADALFHEYNASNQRHMEYVNDHGVFEDPPVKEFLRDFFKAYPKLIEMQSQVNPEDAKRDPDDKFSETAPESSIVVSGQKNLYFEDFEPGKVFVFDAGSISRDEMKSFAGEWDPQPLHLDEEYASSVHGSLIAPGILTMLYIMRPIVLRMISNLDNIGGFGFDNLRWLKPVRPDENLTVHVEITEIRASRNKPDMSILSYTVHSYNPDNELVFKADTGALIRHRKDKQS